MTAGLSARQVRSIGEDGDKFGCFVKRGAAEWTLWCCSTGAAVIEEDTSYVYPTRWLCTSKVYRDGIIIEPC